MSASAGLRSKAKAPVAKAAAHPAAVPKAAAPPKPKGGTKAAASTLAAASAVSAQKAKKGKNELKVAGASGAWTLAGRPDFLNKASMTRELIRKYNARKPKAQKLEGALKGEKLPDLGKKKLARAHAISWMDIRDKFVGRAVNAARGDKAAHTKAMNQMDTLWRRPPHSHKNDLAGGDAQYREAHGILTQHFDAKKPALGVAQVTMLAKLMNSAEPNLRLGPAAVNQDVLEGVHPRLVNGSATPESRRLGALYQAGDLSSPLRSADGTQLYGLDGPEPTTPTTRKLFAKRTKKKGP